MALGLAGFNSSAWAQTVPPGLHAGDVYERIFVTSSTFNVVTGSQFPPDAGTFHGITAADYQVTRAAFEAHLIPNWNGTDLVYHAVLSDDTQHARDRLDIPGPIYNMNDELVARGAADLWDGSLLAAIGYDENGQLVPEGSRVWTGSSAAGQALETGGNWTNPDDFGRVGVAGATNTDWASAFILSANLSEHLYGVSGPLTVLPEPSSVVLAALGFVGLVAWGWPRRSRSYRRSPVHEAAQIRPGRRLDPGSKTTLESGCRCAPA